MNESKSNMAQQIAQAAMAFDRLRTGNHVPKTLSVVLSGGVLVITLYNALSPAEKVLSASPEGAAQMQEFQNSLFENTSASLRQEIARITGLEVREASTQIEPVTGAMVHLFSTGAIVQVFLLGGDAVTESWSGTLPGK